MKAKNKEVNIFNMSLLDILCGALGAFCFMMLVLFPYWRPGGADAAAAQKDAEQLMQEIARLRQQAQASGNAQALEEGFQRLQQQMQQLQGQLNQARNQLQQKDEEIDRLSLRVPLLVRADWTGRQDIDIYVQPDFESGNKRKPGPPNPNTKQQVFFNGEVRTDCIQGPCGEMWLVRDVVAGRDVKIYYKVMAANASTEASNIRSYVIFDGNFYRLPEISMSQDKSVRHVATLRTDKNYKIQIAPGPGLTMPKNE